MTENSHLGLEEDPERRRERLKDLPQYHVTEFSCGAYMVFLNPKTANRKAKEELSNPTDNTEKVLDEML